MGVLTPPQALYVALACIVLISSVIGNFCVIIVILKNKHLRTPTNLFISNLAASDIFMGGILLPQNVHDISHTSDYNEGLFLCKVVTTLPIMCISCSIYSLVAMAVERYRAICTSAGKMSINSAKLVIVACWVVALSICVPTVVEYGVYQEYLDGGLYIEDETADYPTSTPDGLNVSENYNMNNASLIPERPSIRVCGNVIGWTYGLVNGCFLLIAAYVLPLFIITICYGRVAYFLVQQAKQMTSAQGDQGKNFSVQKNKLRIIKMLAVVAALFALCWCPYFVLLLASKVTGKDGTGEASGPLNLMKLSLSIFSVTYNIYIYLAYTASFRTAFADLLCPFLKRNKVSPEEGSTPTETNKTESRTG